MTTSSPKKNGRIPDFDLPASTGKALSSDSFRGKIPLVIVFIHQPRSTDSTSLLEEMDRRLKDFGSERSQILAVVEDTAENVRVLADEMGLSVPLLADASGSMARDLGVDESGRSIAVVADKDGRVSRRFDPFFDGADPAQAVESLLFTVRATGTNALEGPRE